MKNFKQFLEEKIVVHQSKHLKFPDGSIGRISNKRAVVLSNRHSDNIKVYIDSDGDLTLDTGKGDKTFKNIDELVKFKFSRYYAGPTVIKSKEFYSNTKEKKKKDGTVKK